MAGQGGSGRRTIIWVALVGFIGLVVGAIINDSLSFRGSNLIEVTRIVEVTREIVVDQTIEVTRLVEIYKESPTQDSLADQTNDGTASESRGSAIIGVLAGDGRASKGTHTVALYPKTLLDDKGEAQPNRSQEIRIPVNELTGFAEAYGLAAGTYVVCLKSLLHTATVGEIEIVAGEIIRTDLRWPANIETIRVECIL